MSNYWQDRIAKTMTQLYNTSASQMEAELALKYREIAKRIKLQIESLYNEILAASADGTLLTSDLYKYQKYWELLQSTNQQLQRLGQTQIKIMDKRLHSYYKNVCATVGSSYGISTRFNEDLADKAVKSIWCADGKSWSDRVWTDKSKLISAIEQGLSDCLASGATTQRLTETIIRDFNTSFFNTQRLIRTEMAHIQTEATIDKFEEVGVNKVRFVDTEDNRTCQICSDLDGTVYTVEEARGIIPGQTHVQCRCCLLAEIPEDSGITYKKYRGEKNV